ncbi:hypothetical protein, partial [Jatrophihabitans sp.]|uniref:hypothetical protein n=1 Tax=Jatrophihabitans sp. TaxID=1932789 RepID=UPI0030C735DF|nr:hypothetical protein [Jatrophihabitans sp.]
MAESRFIGTSVRRLRWALPASIGLAAGAWALFSIFASSASATPTCTIYWTGHTSTAWSTSSNWSLSDGGSSAGGTPGATDYVCMSTAPTRSAVVYGAGAKSVTGINFAKTATVTPSLEINSGALSVGNSNGSNASTINNLTVDGSQTIGGTSATNLTGTTSFASAAIVAGTGVKTVSGTSEIPASSYLFVGTGTNTTGDLANSGSFTLDSGSIIYLNTLSSAAPATFANSGTLTMGDSSQLYANGSGAVAPTVTNSGTITSAPGINTAYITSAFTNTGAITWTFGQLNLGAGDIGTTTDTGTMAISSGADVDLTAGTRTIAGSVSGAGHLQGTGGNV